MPPHKVQHLLRATFSNIEHLDIEYVRDTLMPWLVRWEGEIVRKLLSDQDRVRYVVKHNVSELMRGDSAARSTYLRTMISTGAMSINEAREVEDLNPVDDAIGSQLFMQGAMTTVEKIITQPAPSNPSQRPGKQTPSRFPEDDETDDDKEEDDDGMDASIFLPVFSDAEARVNRKERMAVTNALRKHPKHSAALTEWAGDFYGEHAGYIADAFAPCIASVEHARQAKEPGWTAPTGHVAAIAQAYCTKHAGTVATAKSPDIAPGMLADAIMAPLMVATPKAKPAPAIASLQPLVLNVTVDDSNATKSLKVERGPDGRIASIAATSTKTKAMAIARDSNGQIVGMQ
jgi:hypothetical protein